MRYTHNPAAPGYRVSTFILHICAFDTFEMRNKTISTDGNVHANCIHGTFNSLSNCAARTHDGNRSAKHKIEKFIAAELASSHSYVRGNGFHRVAREITC